MFKHLLICAAFFLILNCEPSGAEQATPLGGDAERAENLMKKMMGQEPPLIQENGWHNGLCYRDRYRGAILYYEIAGCWLLQHRQLVSRRNTTPPSTCRGTGCSTNPNTCNDHVYSRRGLYGLDAINLRHIKSYEERADRSLDLEFTQEAVNYEVGENYLLSSRSGSDKTSNYFDWGSNIVGALVQGEFPKDHTLHYDIWPVSDGSISLPGRYLFGNETAYAARNRLVEDEILRCQGL